MLNYLILLRNRLLWASPKRKIQTLEGFSHTEIEAGISILRALKFIKDQRLIAHLERHAKDEIRHGYLFKKRAEELHNTYPEIAEFSSSHDKLYKLSATNNDVVINSHGFLTSNNFKYIDDIKYVAMLNIAEKKAENMFSLHYRSLGNDDKTRAIFNEILKDERYHVSYTNKLLNTWKKETGRKNIRSALIFAYRVTIVDKLTRSFSRFGEKIGYAILYTLYFTVIIPFAIISKLYQPKKRWKSSVSPHKGDDLRSQY